MSSVQLRVLFSYTASEQDECNLNEGDVVEGFNEVSGWWRGKSQGKVGIFPANYVERLQASTSPPLPPKSTSTSSAAAAGAQASGSGGGGATDDTWDAKELRTMNGNPMLRRAVAGRAAPMQPADQGGLMPMQANPGAPAVGDLETGGAATPGNAESGGARLVEEKPRPLQITYVAHNMGLGCSLMLVTMGLISIVWDNGPDSAIIRGSTLVGLYSIGIGVALYVFQYRFGLGQRPWQFERERGLPLQGLALVACSGFCFFSNPTILCGIFLITTGLMYTLAWYHREGELQKKANSRRAGGGGGKDKDPAPRTLREVQERGLLPKYIWLLVYIVLNLALWLEAFTRWTQIVDNFNARPLVQKPDGNLSHWTPWAKAFGQLLNFNCSLIMFPILRNLLLWVTKTFDNLGVSLFSVGSKETLYKYAPLSKTIAFHKTIAFVIFISAYMHTVAHFLNFSVSSRAVSATFGVGPWITGGVICLSMFFIYPAASNNVRRGAFRIFWSSHHWFLVFFLFTIFHGPVFIYWSIMPITLFTGERLLRFIKAESEGGFSVKRLKWLEPVLAVYWCPRIKESFHFREGQYVYVCCPAVSEEWHPFTISSAYDDLVQKDFVSVHMKVFKGGWTEKVKNYFQAMNPRGEYPLELTRRDEKGEVQEGKFIGPEGATLLRIDGPHSAPGEHYVNYETAMIIGAGIGLTPIASILQAVTQYKWKRGFHPEILHVYWIVRQEEIPAFQWFIGLLTELERDLQVDRAKQLGYTTDTYLEVNIFVTRCSKDFRTPKVVEHVENKKAIDNKGGGIVHSFSAQQLMDMACHPPVKSSVMSETMRLAMQGAGAADVKNRLQDVWCWDGRPNWDQIFAYVKEQRRYRDIGVCFCGTPIVGKDLKDMCKKYSTLDPLGADNEVMFRLHKENF